MKIKDLWISDMVKDYEFDDETGKYKKQFEEGSITINSWNGKVFIFTSNNTVKIDMIKELKRLLNYLEEE